MTRANCVVDNCCFCADLRTGSFIIGYTALIWSSIVSLIVIVYLTVITYYIGTALIIVLAIDLGLILIRLIFVILLLIGLHQNNRRFVYAFLIYGIVFSVSAVVLCIVGIIAGNSIIDIIITVLDILLNIYFLVVIRSYYLKMNITTTPQFPIQLHPPQYIIQRPPQYIMQQPPPYIMQQSPQYGVHQQQPQPLYQPQHINLHQQHIDFQKQ